jgi:heme/copper-type cytochrome/quinol oxidase subunit 2
MVQEKKYQENSYGKMMMMMMAVVVVLVMMMITIVINLYNTKCLTGNCVSYCSASYCILYSVNRAK